MKNRLFTCIFFCILLSGLLFQLWGRRYTLYGVSDSATVTEELSALMDGTWQSEAETILNEKLVLRSWLIPLRNQISYSLFHTSTHDSIILGKDNYLYEENYILKHLQIISPVSDAYMKELICKLTDLQDRLAADNKQLFIFITPSKAHIYSEYIPDSYLALAPENQSTSSYEKLLAALDEYSLPYYDSVPYVLKNKTSFEYPAFPTTGIHWSLVEGFAVTQRLMDSMEEQLDINLPEFELSWAVTPTALGSDRDIEQLLNIFRGHPDTYYAPAVNITDPAGDSLSVLARGGSFMGTSVYHIMDFHFFESLYYMENTQLISNGDISYFTDYEQLPLAEQLAKADLVLLEVNEESIDTMSFGFIDYLLEHILTE